MMGINAVKGVEIGAGFGSIVQRGSEHGDELTPQGFLSNHSGGILGGISTGQDIHVNIAIKPTSPSPPRAAASTSTATPSNSPPTVDTTPASACAPPPSLKPCSRSCLSTTPCAIARKMPT